MKLKDVYAISKEMDGAFLPDMLDICFPNEHSAYHYLSEGGDECCLDELWSSVGQNYEMPKEFDTLIDAYNKYYEKGEYEKIEEIINKLIKHP